MARTKNKQAHSAQLRIVGGQWRSRKLGFTPADGLRPTADRIRETLFNWLAPVIGGAHCADLFSGSGALGLEALSRGAAHCDFVDSARPAIQQISRHLGTLGASSQGHCYNQSAERYLIAPHKPLDIVFIDPPFGLGLVEPTCQLLEASLATGAWVYIETARGDPAPAVPGHWLLHRDKATGDVAYRLYHCQNS